MPIIMENTIKLFLISIFLLFLQSCNKDDLSKITEIILSSSKQNALVDEEIIFKSVGNNGVDITNETVFYVNDNMIQEDSYIFTTPGIYLVKGIYKDIESNSIEINVNAPTGYSQKVLAEDYTGVWCGYCPRISYAIHEIQSQNEYNDKIVPVAIHLYEHNDPYFCDDAEILANAFQISGLPKGRINRTTSWTSPQEENLDQVTSLIGGSATLGIAIESSIDNNNLNALIRVGFAQDYTTNLGIVVYLLENGLIHNQTNYTSLFGGDYILENFEHNDVLRKIYTNIYGDLIPANEAVADNIYEYNLQKMLPNNIENQDNLTLVVFVVDKETNTVINSQHADIGEEQLFD
jgi:thiol-disulfide isomerase/thioredoxin